MPIGTDLDAASSLQQVQHGPGTNHGSSLCAPVQVPTPSGPSALAVREEGNEKGGAAESTPHSLHCMLDGKVSRKRRRPDRFDQDEALIHQNYFWSRDPFFQSQRLRATR